MPSKLFHLTLTTSEKNIFSGEVSSLVAPCEFGYLGVLADHAPFAANVLPGKIIIRDNINQPIVFDSKGRGFLEVHQNKAAIILDRLN